MGEVTSDPDGLSDWSEACLRLEDYLNAHRIPDRERVLRLNLALVDEARREHARDPSRTPLDVTMSLATQRVEEWFSRLADDTAPPDSRLAARGRALWFTNDLHQQFPSAFLAEPPPDSLRDAVRSVTLRTGPDLELARLTRQEVDYGPMEDIASGTWQQFSWGHVLRAFLIWVCIFFAVYGSYLAFFQK